MRKALYKYKSVDRYPNQVQHHTAARDGNSSVMRSKQHRRQRAASPQSPHDSLSSCFIHHSSPTQNPKLLSKTQLSKAMGLTFASPISYSSSAYDKAHRTRSTAYTLPLPKHKTTLLERLKSKSRKSFGGFGGPNSYLAVDTAKSLSPGPAKQSRFFRLPLAVREKIYGYIVGQNELLHMLLRYRAAPSRWKVAYRRCTAGGNVDYCILHRCREFHDFVKASYFGYFDHVGGLFRSCQDMQVNYCYCL